MAISCPSCGLANADDATECRRCRAPFAESAAEDISAGLGALCERCEAYNEPGVGRCTTCGYKLSPGGAAKPADPLDKGAPEEEASAQSSASAPHADAGPLWAGEAQPPRARAEQHEFRAGPLPRGWAAAEAAMASASSRKRTAATAAIALPTPPPQLIGARKPCAACGAENAPAAKFCSECGTPSKLAPAADTPFAQESPRAGGDEETADDWAITTDPTGRTAPIADADGDAEPLELPDEPLEPKNASPEPLGWDAAIGDAAASEEHAFASALAEAAAGPAAQPTPLEPELPYQASLVVERGNAAGTSFVLARIENVLGRINDAATQAEVLRVLAEMFAP